jgi:hypothetical protein
MPAEVVPRGRLEARHATNRVIVVSDLSLTAPRVLRALSVLLAQEVVHLAELGLTALEASVTAPVVQVALLIRRPEATPQPPAWPALQGLLV